MKDTSQGGWIGEWWKQASIFSFIHLQYINISKYRSKDDSQDSQDDRDKEKFQSLD